MWSGLYVLEFRVERRVCHPVPVGDAAAVVLNLLAMPTSVSPRSTVYERKVGPGVGVGRTNDGVGVGPAGVGPGRRQRWAGAAVGLRSGSPGPGRRRSRASRAGPREEPPGRASSSIVTHLAPRPVTTRVSRRRWLAGSTGVGACSDNSAARARPSAAVAMRSRPLRLATKQARSAASSTSVARRAVVGERPDADRGGDCCRPEATTAWRARSATCMAPAASVPGNRNVNSSPPYRKMWSLSRPAWTRLAGDPPQQHVAGLVAEVVVDVPEVVEVQHDQAERRAVADAPFEPLLERAVVEQPGQVVGPGADLDRLEDLRVLERDRHLRREELDELELLARERIADAEPLDRQHADRPAPAAQRDDDEAAVDRRRSPHGSG